MEGAALVPAQSHYVMICSLYPRRDHELINLDLGVYCQCENLPIGVTQGNTFRQLREYMSLKTGPCNFHAPVRSGEGTCTHTQYNNISGVGGSLNTVTKWGKNGYSTDLVLYAHVLPLALCGKVTPPLIIKHFQRFPLYNLNGDLYEDKLMYVYQVLCS